MVVAAAALWMTVWLVTTAPQHGRACPMKEEEEEFSCEDN
jgi:hypothetical protein